MSVSFKYNRTLCIYKPRGGAAGGSGGAPGGGAGGAGVYIGGGGGGTGALPDISNADICEAFNLAAVDDNAEAAELKLTFASSGKLPVFIACSNLRRSFLSTSIYHNVKHNACTCRPIRQWHFICPIARV